MTFERLKNILPCMESVSEETRLKILNLVNDTINSFQNHGWSIHGDLVPKVFYDLVMLEDELLQYNSFVGIKTVFIEAPSESKGANTVKDIKFYINHHFKKIINVLLEDPEKLKIILSHKKYGIILLKALYESISDSYYETENKIIEVVKFSAVKEGDCLILTPLPLTLEFNIKEAYLGLYDYITEEMELKILESSPWAHPIHIYKFEKTKTIITYSNK